MKLRPIQELSELKKIQLGILKYVAEFCERNEICYHLTAGTLLGAVRHRGFIPWDDDIDIAMTRENYDKFIRLFSDPSGKYSFHCVENDKKYCYPMGKVFDEDTILYEPDSKHGYKIAVYIDVFVWDFLPDNLKVIKRLYDKRDFYLRLRALQKSTQHRGCLLRRICVHMLGKLLSAIPSRFFAEAIVRNAKEFRYTDRLNYGSLLGYSRLVLDRKLIDSVIKMEFEGELYNVPIGYDECLTAVYGEYMELPSSDNRIPSHHFEAYHIIND